MLDFTLWLLSFNVLARQAVESTKTTETILVPLTREFISLLEDEKRYNKYATPTQHLGTATNVSMSMFIEGISSFSAQTMDYQLDVYFYQEWKDERLKHNGSGPLLIRDKAVFKKLWHPDIYFANARHASFQEITEDNFLVWIYPNGRIWYDCRISLVAICMMDLWKYPLDAQTCELRILSYAYPENHLRLRWSKRIDPPIDRNMGIKMPDMELVRIATGECNGSYVTGTWSCQTAVFYVERAMLHHIIQTYVPTSLIVIISWFNFWLDIDAAPARVTLSITTLLTIATQANAVKLALPEYTIAHFAKNQEYLFQLAGQNSSQTPLVVDTDGFNTLLAASKKVVEEVVGNDPEAAMEIEQFLTTEQLHRHWRRTVCGVYSNGGVPNEETGKKNWHTMKSSLSTRSFRSAKMGGIKRTEPDFEVSTATANNLLENHQNHRQQPQIKLNDNDQINNRPSLFNIEDPRLKKISRSLPEDFHFEYGADKIQRKNSFVGSARLFKKQMTRRARVLKQTLNQLRGREMATKIDQKSRIIFPFAFFVMNVFYWGYYLILN
uniref:Neur_chan_LBD domain-containing protein n=1 Tax=Globodera pallida TaxID=36090 RepID=A0A183BJR5_GLOPA